MDYKTPIQAMNFGFSYVKALARVQQAKLNRIPRKIANVALAERYPSCDPTEIEENGLKILCDTNSLFLFENYGFKVSSFPRIDNPIFRLEAHYRGEGVFAAQLDNGYKYCVAHIARYNPGKWENVLNALYRSKKVQDHIKQTKADKAAPKIEERRERLENIVSKVKKMKHSFSS